MVEIGAGKLNTLDPYGGPKVWEREGRDVALDTLKTARDIGQVRLNHSRLNVFSNISEGEKEDNFKFQVASPGNLRLGNNIDDQTRVQILNHRGRVIADSKEGTGRHYEKYLRMIDDKGEPFDKGNYFLKVSRLDSKETATERPYTLQLQIGTTIKHDYETLEYEAKKPKPGEPTVIDPTAGITPSAATLQAQGAASVLTEGANNLTNILSGVFNTLFNKAR